MCLDLYLGIVPSSSTTLVRKSVKDFDEFEGFDEFPNIFFHAHPPVEIFVPLNLNEKKKKKKKISTRSLFKSGFQKRTRFHPQSEGRKFNEFPSVLYKIYGGWRRERERERDRFYISHHPSLIEGEKKSVRGRRKRKVFEERRRRILEM